MCVVLESSFSLIFICDFGLSTYPRRDTSYDPERPIPVDCEYVLMLLNTATRLRRETRMTILESRALAAALSIDTSLPKQGGYRYPDYTRLIVFLCTIASSARYSHQEGHATVIREYHYWILRVMDYLDRPTSRK